MDGNQDRDCMTADLEALYWAGLRKALFFEVNIGVSRGPVIFESLVPWNTHAERGIRYYSGEATYHKSFDQPANVTAKTQLFLDLGVVHKIARVKLNSKDLGIVWMPPFRVEVTGKLLVTGNKSEMR